MSQTADLSRPLSDDELDRLERILLDRVDEDAVTDDTDEGVLTVSELDGLLTALVSGPVTVVPSRWLPAVWGDFEPTWNSQDDCQDSLSLIVRHMNDIAVTLVEAPETFEPMYLETTGGDDPIVIVESDTTDWLAHELPEPEAAKLRDAIAPSVRALHAYWLDRRGEGAQNLARQARASTRVGRNEPCPCGSGKKYKKCCLQ